MKTEIEYEREKEDISFIFEGKKYWAEEYEMRVGNIVSLCNICKKRGLGMSQTIAIPTKISSDDEDLDFDVEQELLKKIKEGEKITKMLGGKLRLIREEEEKKYFICYKCVKNNTPEELEKLLSLMHLKELRFKFKELLKQKEEVLKEKPMASHELEEQISELAKEIDGFQKWEDS